LRKDNSVNAPSVFLPHEPPSFECEFVNEISCIYRILFGWVWVEILGFFPKPAKKKQFLAVFPCLTCTPREGTDFTREC